MFNSFKIEHKLIMKLRNITPLMGVLLLLLLLNSSVSVGAQPDGLSSTSEGKVFVQGVVTKDITDTSNIFTGIYGGSKTFTFGSESTGLSNFRLQDGTIQTYGGSDGYGNISANPAEIVHSSYNSSGYLDRAWTVGNPSSITESVTYVATNDVAGAPQAVRFYASGTVTAVATEKISWSKTLTASIPTSKYLVFGAYVNQFTFNTSSYSYYTLHLQLKDVDGNIMVVAINNGTSNFGSYSYTGVEGVRYPYKAESVIFYQQKISELDALASQFTMSSITDIGIKVNTPSASTVTGSLSIDVFALEFLDSPLKFGEDRGDQLTSASDYVYLNVTDVNKPDLSVRDIDSGVTSIVDANIDFIANAEVSEEIYDDEALTQTQEWEYKVATPVDWQDEVSLANMTSYYVMDQSAGDYNSFAIDDVDSDSKLLNEVAGDVITLKSGMLEDTTYRLKLQKQLDEESYDIAVGKAAEPLTFWDGVVIFFTVSIPAFIGFSKYAKKNKRSIVTKRANKR